MSEADPAVRLWDLMRGALGTKALAIAADLRVADALAGGPRPVAELARETGADADTLARILRALASDGVFAEDEGEPGVFRNTEASELLRIDDPRRSHDFAHLFGGPFYEAVAGLEAGSREASFPGAFGTDFWSWLSEHPDERASFDRAMSGRAMSGQDEFLDALAGLDWRGGETVVDVGGGNGSLLTGLLRRRTGLRGIVFDLPDAEAAARRQLAEAGVGDRCTFVAGSFFESVPAGDVYVLSKILHDWDDERAAAILSIVRAGAPDDARLVVRDAVLAPGNEPHGAKWLDLLMLAMLSGRERSEPEWRALLEGAGFELEHVEDGLIRARCRTAGP